jgi:predicted Zn-dependent protease
MLHLGDAAKLAQMSLDLFTSLPFGRAQESEADEIGLVYMAMAGYDPREAISFWQRMESQHESAPFEFLSTHPSNESRIEHLKAKLPEALGYWRAAVGGASR